MRIGIISGSGTYEWPGLSDAQAESRRTDYGDVQVTTGRCGDADVVHVSRHGSGHARLSNHVQHRANISALLHAKVDAVVSLTLCGAVARDVEPGSLIVFDHLYFPANRLPEGDLCTWYHAAGTRGRGHWIFERPYSDSVRWALLDAAAQCDVTARDGGCYGQVDGPRFNSRSEIASLALAGVTAVSQTAGPEIVLAGEAELPLAVVGFVTDFANGVAEEPEPVSALLERMAQSGALFARLMDAFCRTPQVFEPAGFVYRFDD